MSHVSDDVLAAIALGDLEVTPEDRLHVASCPVCSQELAELVQVHGLLRQEVGMRVPHRVEPGPAVWERIVAATQEPIAPQPRAPEPRPLEVPVDQPVSPETPVPQPVASRSAARERRRPVWWLVAAAAACLVIGAFIGRAVFAPVETPPPVVASVALTTLDAAKQQEGTAKLLGGQGGQADELRVDTRPMSPGSGYVEVWLINTDGKRMVSLGVLSGTEATFPVPADAIAQGYTIVDLSREQFDDKPQHSGDSIMRGTLPI